MTTNNLFGHRAQTQPRAHPAAPSALLLLHTPPSRTRTAAAATVAINQQQHKNNFLSLSTSGALSSSRSSVLFRLCLFVGPHRVSPPPPYLETSMEDDVSTPAFTHRRIWRDGATRRVGLGAALAAAGGAALAAARHLPAPHVARTSASCAVIACPFFALREAVAGGLAVDGPVASAIVGGLFGYVGALAFSSSAASWKAVSHGAMVVGVGAGLVDVVASTVDFQWKAFLLARRDAALLEKHHHHHHHIRHHALSHVDLDQHEQHHHQKGMMDQQSVNAQIEVIRHGNHADDFNVSVVNVPEIVTSSHHSTTTTIHNNNSSSSTSTTCQTSPTDVQLVTTTDLDVASAPENMSTTSSSTPSSSTTTTKNPDADHVTTTKDGDIGVNVNTQHSSTTHSSNNRQRPETQDLPMWMPAGSVALRDRDEYERLLQSRKATAAALQHEQDRIARLLATIERLKADEGNTEQTPLPPPSAAKVA